ncbi:hypothetical protein ACFQ5F_09020 [Kroppenstedtia eburnea]|uniref:hypothetical protein n=1 Tax=Kroppenstedtia eburnea TaxID=714067 RepID=UPI00362CCB35
MWIPVGNNSYLIFEVFEFALDLDEPWKLMNLEFDVEAQTWHLYIDFKRGATIKCPLCDSGCRLVPSAPSANIVWKITDWLGWWGGEEPLRSLQEIGAAPPSCPRLAEKQDQSCLKGH